ncbi:YDG domain-containing protein [Hymenobacter sp. BT635]|uniref:YDG domain-containing protein n=1 Tax=Hymenobacter nitidus TaxID=2880929 RepID=A0ABS8ADQ6_9BACT|nr:YDG domain-containing protein [Hymenobacter nitidus]
MLGSLTALAQTAPYTPTVSSDKDDYSPGQVAHITGAGWIQDQLVHVEFQEEPDYPDFHSYDVAVDAAGRWQIDYNIEQRHLGVRFTVTAVGQTTGTRAQTVFTDGPGLALTILSPSRNARSAPRMAAVSALFDLNLLNNATVAGSLKVFSQQAGGKRAGTATVSGNALSFPVLSFKPGETVYSTITSAVESNNGNKNLVPGQVFQFTTAAAVAPGTFSGGAEVSSVTSPMSVALGDVDGDGDLDMLVTSTSTNTINIRLNNGTGGFSTPAANAQVSVGSQAYYAALGDIDSDGDLDMVTANYSSTNASVRLNNGAGVFTAPATNSEVPVGSGAYNIALGDLDADGDLDMVSTNGAGTASVRFNNGQGSFTAPATNAQVTIGTNPSCVVLGDIDGDGDLDILAANHAAGTVSVRLNNNAGVFTSPATNAEVPVGSAPISLAIGDVDGDGDLDMLTASNGISTMNVRLNNGSGSFSAPSANAQVALGSSDNRKLALGDIDGDGDLDALIPTVTTNRVIIRLNNGTGIFTAPATNPEVAVGNYPQHVVLGDIDGDQDLDMVAANQQSNSASVRLNQLAPPTITSLAPPSGPVGTSVIITGTNFTGTSAVTFNGTAAPGFVVNSATQITVSVPPGATTGPVLVKSNAQSSNGVAFTVQQSQSITFAALDNKIYGEAPFLIAPTASSGLPVSVAVSGPASYNTTTGEVTVSGIGSVTITATQAGSPDFLAAPAVSRTFTVAPATPSLAWGPLPDSMYGDDLNGKLTATAAAYGTAVPGTYVYKLGPTVLTAATRLNARATAYILTVEFTPASPNYTPATGSNSLLVQKANQTIAWNAPAPISYGTALGSNQLMATVAGVASGSEPGPLSYLPAAGTVLNAGPDQTLTVTAGATDNYHPASKSVLLTVSPVNPTVTAVGGSFFYDKQAHGGSGSATGVGTPPAALAPVALRYSGTGATSYGPSSAAPTQAGTYSVTASYPGSTNYNAATSEPAELTIQPGSLMAYFTAADKVYDATTGASITSRTVTGAVAGDDVQLAGGTAVFNNATVGSGKLVTAGGFTLTGADAANYRYSPSAPSAQAAITARPLTITGLNAVSRPYNGTTTATVAGTPSLSGVAADETPGAVSLTGTATGSFASAGVGTGKSVAVTGLTLAGAAAPNYTLALPTPLTADITPQLLTPSFTAASKPYDGTTAATITTRSVTGRVGSEDVTLAGGTAAFADAQAGTGKTVTGSGFTLSGPAADNYTLGTPPIASTTTADITTVQLTAHIRAADKVYDGTAAATLTAQSVSGQLSGDEVSLTVSTASFATKTAGPDKTVTAAGLALTGADALNYRVNPTATTTATITPRPLSIGISASSKLYDGTRSATTTALLPAGSGQVPGDDLAVSSSNGEFDTRNVGAAKPVTATVAISGGADQLNYFPLSSTAATTASITPVALGAAITASDKIYDATTLATIATRTLTGVIADDEVSLSGGTASFASAAAGTGKSVTANNLTLLGQDAGNYTITGTASTTAAITAKPVTAALAATDKVYDGTAAATATGSLPAGAVLGTDEVTVMVTAAAFDNAAAGPGKPVTATVALGGTAAGNYQLTAPTAATTASITAKGLTPGFTAAPKMYDGTRAALILTRTLTGVHGMDAVTLSGGTAAFDDKNVGLDKPVVATGFTLTGAAAGNYALAPAASATATATITPATLTYLATPTSRLYGNANGPLGGTVTGFVNGETPATALGGTISFTSPATATSPVGTYASNGSGLTANFSNYLLVQAPANTTALTVTARPVTITASSGQTKVYGSPDPASYSYTVGGSGLAATDAFSGVLRRTEGSNVGDYAIEQGALTILNSSTNASTVDNYTVSYLPSDFTITPKLITVTPRAGQGRIYGAPEPALLYEPVSLVGTDAFSGALTREPGTTVGAYTILRGTLSLSSNYTLSVTPDVPFRITEKQLTASISAPDKTYDGTAAATVTGTVPAAALISGDAVNVVVSNAVFSDKAAAPGKLVTATVALSGPHAFNYSLSADQATTRATIKPAGLMPTFTAASRVYDGSPEATITGRSISGQVAGDVVSLSNGTATFATKNVGIGKTVTGQNFALAGTDAGNYYLLNPRPTTTATISPRPLTITATGIDKLFDGTTSASVTLGDDRVPNDMLSRSYASATFSNANVGSAKPVAVSGISIGDADAGNYTFNPTASTTAAILLATSNIALTTPGPVQYSDQATFTATVTSPSAQAVLGSISGTVDFYLSSGANTYLLGSAAFPGPGGLTTVTKAFAIGQKADTYSTSAVFKPTSTNIGGATSAAGSLLVNRENTDIVYSGLEYFGTSSPISASANVEYIATLTDAADQARGTITYARAVFKLANGASETNLFGTTSFAVSSISPTESLVGTARSGVHTVTLNASDISSGGRTFGVITEAQGDYYTGRTPEYTLITIAVPGQDYVNGGGNVVVAQSGGTYAAAANSKMNFGFTMKWNKSGKNIQGQANIIFRRLVAGVWRTYQIKSNAINTLGTVSTAAGNQGDFNTKANLTDITNPLSPVGIGGSLDLSVQAFESTVTGTPHQMGVTLRASTGELLFSNNWIGGKTQLLALRGGKISVRSSTSTAPPAAKPGVALANSTAGARGTSSALEVYPNPMADQATIQFHPQQGGKAQVYLYNHLGALITTLYNAEVERGRAYFLPLTSENLPNGVYICRLILNGNAENKRISLVK